MRMRRLTVAAAVCATALALTVPATAASAASSSPGQAKKAASHVDPLGLVVVRFKPGTSASTMKSIVTSAGGTVLTDLSALRALSVAPGAGTVTKLKADGRVQAVWREKVLTSGRDDVDPADAGVTGSNTPNLGTKNPTIPDPWHDASSFLGETNPRGILQWDDLANGATGAWATTTGNRSVRVAVIDTGVEGAHKELLPNYDQQSSANTIPCNQLTQLFGPKAAALYGDCSSGDTEGHGTWVASRIAGAVNGFASNGIAPGVTVMGFKTLSTRAGGGLTSWIVDGMVRACDADADLINMSLGGYNDMSADGQADTQLWIDAVSYCRAKGTAIIASAGNEHVRINRTTLTINGSTVAGIGQVDTGDEGIASIVPGGTVADSDLRGLVQTPAGIPGVIMVSATNNAIGDNPSTVHPDVAWPSAKWGKQDQLTYYSSYGSRIDITAPGGARKFNIPRYDGGPSDILYGGWGELGALTANGEICQDPSLASLLTFACFKANGAAFGWLQGTSMSAPNATGVAALTLAAHPALQEHPDALLAQLTSTARTNMVNFMGPNDPLNTAPSYFGVPCPTGFCHVKLNAPISFGDAYGAGMVNAAAAVS